MRFKWLAWTAVTLQALLLLYATVIRAGDLIAMILTGSSTATIVGFILGSLLYVFTGWAVVFLAVVAIRECAVED